jgi:glutaryl-CoA dehydrogenase
MEGPVVNPHDFLNVDALLSDEEGAIGTERFEAGTMPADVVPGLGKLGVLGMHLEGYGCAATTAVPYRVACRELEAVDSGLRSLVSVQGSLAMSGNALTGIPAFR